MLGLYFYHKFCFHSRFPFFPYLHLSELVKGCLLLQWPPWKLLSTNTGAYIWYEDMNPFQLRCPQSVIPSGAPASVFVKVRIGEGAPCDFLFSLHIFTPIIYFWSFCWLPSFSIIFVSWHRCWRSKKIWKPRRDLGGTLITTQVQSSECIRP